MSKYVTGTDENGNWVVAWSEGGQWRALCTPFAGQREAVRCARKLREAERKYPMLAAIPTPYRVIDFFGGK